MSLESNVLFPNMIEITAEVRTEGARATKAAAKDTPTLVKKIGRTTYIVRVHFSKTSREAISDKIKRMLKNEIQQM